MAWSHRNENAFMWWKMVKLGPKQAASVASTLGGAAARIYTPGVFG